MTRRPIIVVCPKTGLAQSAAIIDSLRARVRELETKENANA